MELKVINVMGKEPAAAIQVDDAVFGREYNESLVHQVVTAFLANARSGTRAQKTRAEVSHSTRKPFKQKGTGRARAGMTSSPLWRGGGRTFPNRPDENFTQKINRKMYRAAMSSIMSQLIRDERLMIADKIEVDSPKTKGVIGILKNMSVDQKRVLIVVDELSEDLFLASRNLQNVLILETHQIDPYNLLRFNVVVFTAKALEHFQQGQLA